MRVLLVGSPSDRTRLRADLNGSVEIAGEFTSIVAARTSGIEAHAIVLAAGQVPRDEAGVEALTAREIEVLELLAEGLPNKAIAGRLGISDKTVKFHVSSITCKLGAANRTDAVRRAVRRGLIPL
jgi:DNA-binding NarL/FixJ family response regulator